MLCIIREKGHPVQLVNAFEEPVISKNGIVAKSVDKLKNEYKSMKDKWALPAVAEIEMPEKGIAELLAEVEKHVN